MKNKKFLKKLKEERDALHEFEKKLSPIITNNPQHLEVVLMDVVARRIMDYFFKEGKFKLFYTISKLPRIAANIVLYMELQRHDSDANIQQYIQGYEVKKSYKKSFWKPVLTQPKH